MPGRPHPDPHWIAVFRSREDPDGVEGRLVEVTDDSVTVETVDGQIRYEPIDTTRFRTALALGGFRPGANPAVWIQDQWRMIRVPLPSGGGTQVLSTYGARKTLLP